MCVTDIISHPPTNFKCVFSEFISVLFSKCKLFLREAEKGYCNRQITVIEYSLPTEANVFWRQQKNRVGISAMSALRTGSCRIDEIKAALER